MSCCPLTAVEVLELPEADAPGTGSVERKCDGGGASEGSCCPAWVVELSEFAIWDSTFACKKLTIIHLLVLDYRCIILLECTMRIWLKCHCIPWLPIRLRRGPLLLHQLFYLIHEKFVGQFSLLPLCLVSIFRCWNWSKTERIWSTMSMQLYLSLTMEWFFQSLINSKLRRLASLKSLRQIWFLCIRNTKWGI